MMTRTRRINEEGYIVNCDSSKNKNSVAKTTTFLVKPNGISSHEIRIGKVAVDKELLGKRFRIKIEEIGGIDMEMEELVFKYDGFTLRVKKDFVRIDISRFEEADDYYVDFSNREEVIEVARLLEEKIK